MGFWGKLAKGVGAGLAGVATLPIGGPAWLTPALMAGGGILSSLGSRGTEGTGDAQIKEVLKRLADMGIISAEQFKNFSDRANIASGETMNFLSKLMASDPATRAEFLAPEINDIGETYKGALDTLQKFGPRGGETDRAKTLVRTGRAGEVARLLSTSRIRGAELMSQFAGQQGQLALGFGQAATGANTGGGWLSTQNRGMNMGRDLETGRSIGGIVEQILSMGKGKKGGGGGGTVSTEGWWPQMG